MTISTTYAPVQYTGNAVTTAFSFPYTFFLSTDLLIYLDGVLQASGYTVTGGSGSSGTVTFSSAPASGVIVTIALSLPYTQLDDYVENQAFPAQTLESGLDKAALRDQQLNNRLNRALVFPDTLTGSLVGILPQPVDGMLLSWDGTTGTIANSEVADISTSLDAVFTSLTTGDYIIYNGTNWINEQPSFDTLQAGGAAGVVIKNSGGTTVATIGPSNTTSATFTGNTTIQGLLAIQGITYATGRIEVAGNSTAAGYLKLFEDTDNGTNSVTITPPQSIASDYTVTLPSTAGTLLVSGTQAEIEAETSGKGMDGANAKYHPAMPKAWVNFNGTGTVAIRASYNVSSITDNGTGNYTVNLTTAMSSANYCVNVSASQSTTAASTGAAAKIDNLATGSFRIQTSADGSSASTLVDNALIMATVWGDFA